MSSERIQRRIERLLDLAKAAAERSDWEESRRIAEDILAVDPENADAQAYIVSELHLRIEGLLSQAKTAADRNNWEESRKVAELVLAMDPDNALAQSYVLDAVQGTIGHLLDQVEEAADRREWREVHRLAEDVIAVDPGNVDAQTYIVAAERMLREHSLPEEFFDEAQEGYYEVVIESHSGANSGDIWVRNRKLRTLPVKEDLILRYLYRNRGRVIRLEQIMTECGAISIFKSPVQAKAVIQECIGSLR